MQKQKKQFIVMIILLAACILAYIGLRIYNHDQEEKEQKEADATKIIVTDIAQDEIIAFSYQYEDEHLTLVKEDGIWYYKDDKAVSIDQDKVAAMLETAASIEAQESISDYEDLAEYGLKNPANTITITLENQTITLLLGDENSILGQEYLKKDGDETVYLVEKGIKTTFEKRLEDLTAAETENTEE